MLDFRLDEARHDVPRVVPVGRHEMQQQDSLGLRLVAGIGDVLDATLFFDKARGLRIGTLGPLR